MLVCAGAGLFYGKRVIRNTVLFSPIVAGYIYLFNDSIDFIYFSVSIAGIFISSIGFVVAVYFRYFRSPIFSMFFEVAGILIIFQILMLIMALQGASLIVILSVSYFLFFLISLTWVFFSGGEPSFVPADEINELIEPEKAVWATQVSSQIVGSAIVLCIRADHVG